jgi:glyoxylase-like metal-dependent hydrolase (beta-lactamase superfamily II)
VARRAARRERLELAIGRRGERRRRLERLVAPAQLDVLRAPASAGDRLEEHRREGTIGRLLDRFDIAHVRADNPSPFTLTGTNSYVVGRDPCFIVDPGPLLDAHVAALRAQVEARGGLGGIALTHNHADHTEALAAFAGVDVAREGRIGPLASTPTPGHSPDHVAWLLGDRVCFSGDAVLGEGSVFVAPDPGALRGYLDALRRLRELPLELLLPGHGPPVGDPAAKLDSYVAHRLDRERRLLAALDAGKRSVDDLLDDAWSDAPAILRPAATVTLAAHLDKLDEEGRLPDGVERPGLPPGLGGV